MKGNYKIRNQIDLILKRAVMFKFEKHTEDEYVKFGLGISALYHMLTLLDNMIDDEPDEKDKKIGEKQIELIDNGFKGKGF